MSNQRPNKTFPQTNNKRNLDTKRKGVLQVDG